MYLNFCGQQRVEAVVDLLLPGGADLVMGPLDLQAGSQAGAHHAVADVSHLVVGGDREVAALERGFIALVTALLLAACVPGGLGGVDGVEGLGRGGLVAYRVEEVELGLGADVAGVSDSGGAQVVLGREGIDDREVDDQRLLLAEGVEEGCGHIRDQLHVRLVDRGEASDRGAVEHEAVGEGLILEGGHGNGEVLHDAG